VQVYTTNLNKLYDKEIKDYMEAVKQHMYHLRTDRKGIITIHEFVCYKTMYVILARLKEFVNCLEFYILGHDD